MTDEFQQQQQPQNICKKTVQESEAETTIVMLPSDANPLGNVFGGMILKYVDLLAGLVAKRHAGHANIVTASMDSMTFLKPVYIGNALILKAKINYVRRSSMEVEVKIEAEDLNKSQKGSHRHSLCNPRSTRRKRKADRGSSIAFKR